MLTLLGARASRWLWACRLGRRPAALDAGRHWRSSVRCSWRVPVFLEHRAIQTRHGDRARAARRAWRGARASRAISIRVASSACLIWPGCIGAPCRPSRCFPGTWPLVFASLALWRGRSRGIGLPVSWLARWFRAVAGADRGCRRPAGAGALRALSPAPGRRRCCARLARLGRARAAGPGSAGGDRLGQADRRHATAPRMDRRSPYASRWPRRFRGTCTAPSASCRRRRRPLTGSRRHRAAPCSSCRGTSRADGALYVYWSTAHWQPIVNGYGSFEPPGNFGLGLLGNRWPSNVQRTCVSTESDPLRARARGLVEGGSPGTLAGCRSAARGCHAARDARRRPRVRDLSREPGRPDTGARCVGTTRLLASRSARRKQEP